MTVQYMFYVMFVYTRVSKDTYFHYVFLCLFVVCMYVCLSSSIS